MFSESLWFQENLEDIQKIIIEHNILLKKYNSSLNFYVYEKRSEVQIDLVDEYSFIRLFIRTFSGYTALKENSSIQELSNYDKFKLFVDQFVNEELVKLNITFNCFYLLR